jgi:hypothetical protein
MVERVDLVRVVRPALNIKPTFQEGSLSTPESTGGWRLACLSLKMDNGIPRYMHEKLDSKQLEN